MKIGLCVLAIAALALATRATSGPSPAMARVETGEIQGAVFGDIEVFRAIPYAAPPVGELRWRAPQPPAAWKGVRQAARNGPACMQTEGGGAFLGPQSEDCLTLNVFTPLFRRGARLPVMVWIHGGGYAGGTGSRYDGSHFAADGVVFVAVNYRLGRLGFFAHPAIARTSPDGNLADFGLMDQIAALKWVKDNIAAFGGDPANVTVFGESAGAASVNALLVSPKARGLFAKAISESSFAAIAPATLAQARAAAVSFAEGLGIKAEDPIEVAAALRGRTASAYGARVPPLSDPGAPKPILDGVVLARDPLVAFARGEQARVPLIIGGNSFEASLFADPIAAALESGGGQPGWNPATDLAAFGAGDPAKAAADFITLSRVIEPDRRLARDDAKAGVPAFVYYFSYVPEAMRAHVQGASHGAEISYVFGSIHKDAAPADTAIGRAMHAYWVAFAKTGRPDVKGAVVWPAVSPKDDVLLEFGVDGVRPRRDFDKARLDLLEARAIAAEGKP